MVDNKRIKEVSSATSLTTATFGALPSTGVDGVVSVVRGSQSGVLFVAITDPAGSGGATANDSKAGGAPSGVNVVGLFEAAPPTYVDGDPVIAHFDNRGRLLVSLGEGVITADVDTDQSAGPATPVGQYVIGKREATLPTYADGENCVFHFDSRGRLLMASIDPATGNIVDISTEDSAGPTNPTGGFMLGLYRSSLPSYTDGDAANFHFASNGRLLTSSTGAAPATGAFSTVAASAASVNLLALNSSRLGAVIVNESATATLRVKLGATASATSYTYLLGPNATLELENVYTGVIDGIWTAAVGNARITELT